MRQAEKIGEGMEEKIGEVFVGIDVAKATLDIAIRPSGEEHERHLANDSAGIAALVNWLTALGPQLIVVEATGGYEAPLVAELGIAQLPVTVVNPRQVRAFARATGRLAKTDRLDAQTLAHFGQAVRPTPRPLPDAETQALAASSRGGRRAQWARPSWSSRCATTQTCRSVARSLL